MLSVDKGAMQFQECVCARVCVRVCGMGSSGGWVCVFNKSHVVVHVRINNIIVVVFDAKWWTADVTRDAEEWQTSNLGATSLRLAPLHHTVRTHAHTLSVCLCVCVSVYVSLCVSMSLCLYVCLCLGLCARLCISLCASLSVYICVCVSVWQYKRRNSYSLV